MANRSLDAVSTAVRTRLSLPEPKSGSYGGSMSDVSLSGSTQESSDVDNYDSTIVDSSMESDAPRSKKFIRRNAYIYSEKNCA